LSLSARLRSSNEGNQKVQDKIAGLVKESDVVVFMKGVPEQPRLNMKIKTGKNSFHMIVFSDVVFPMQSYKS
jgi:hypothetical protein